MPALPWVTVSQTQPDEGLVVMASRFRLSSTRAVPGFFVASMRIHRQARQSPGAVGLALDARPLARTFLTLSAWRDRTSLMSFVGNQPHKTAMARFRKHMAEATFQFWTVRADELPLSWEQAQERLDDARATNAADAFPTG